MDKNISAEVITIGSELVLGQILDTNAAFIARALSEIGVDLAYHTTVGDNKVQMAETFRIALDRCDVVITTGGIGPTEDDLTREIWAEVFDTQLEFRPELWEHIQNLFKRAGFSLAPNNRRQAFIPKGAEVIDNPRGTAPAFYHESESNIIFCVPGVPAETEPLIREVVLPRIKKKFKLTGRIIKNRVLKVYGLGESNVDNALKQIIVSSKNPTVGLQAARFLTLVRMTAHAADQNEADRLLDDCEKLIFEKVGQFIFAREDETLAGNIAALLTEKNLSIAIADGLTSGVVCSELGQSLEGGLFKGGLIVSGDASPQELCRRLESEFNPDITLSVVGQTNEEGLVKVSVHVGGSGFDYDKSQDFGGNHPIVISRGGSMALFTLYSLLKGDLR